MFPAEATCHRLKSTSSNFSVVVARHLPQSWNRAGTTFLQNSCRGMLHKHRYSKSNDPLSFQTNPRCPAREDITVTAALGSEVSILSICVSSGLAPDPL